MSQVFGYATISAASQSPEGTVSGANPAHPAFIEGSACLVNASFFDTTGAALVPTALSYRIDDIDFGTQILTWTSLTPASTLQLVITSAENALVSPDLNHETHQVLFQITDPSGNGPFYARCLFDLLRIPGVS